MSPTIFKAYDIRGLSPGEIDEAAARRIGQALAVVEKPKSVIIGRDMRATSDELESALIDGLTESGVDITVIGKCSTPMFNFAIGEAAGAYDLGVMVTASHNPSQYNGFKLTRGDCLPIGQGSGMEELRDVAVSSKKFPRADKPGKRRADDGVLDRYLTRVVGLAGLPAKLPAWTVAIDAGNGMDGFVLPGLTKRLKGLAVVPLYWELDGTFPNHEANPLKVETLEKLRATIVDKGCAFGAAFDGDGDRVGFVDEQGTPIPGDILTALFAREMLSGHPGGKILYDLRSSWSVPEAIREAGGEPIMCKVGHANIKRQMYETGAVFAGELSMHFYFSDMWNCESGDLALLLLLKMLVREEKPLSQLWRPLVRYAHSDEINFRVKDEKAVIAALESFYRKSATDVSHLDGLRLELRNPKQPAEDWWFSVRLSNTEPLLRLNLEARTVEEMERRKAELIALITAH